MKNPRPAICRVLAAGGNLEYMLQQALQQTPARQHGWVRDLLYGTQRWLISIDWLLAQRLKKPLGETDQDIHWLLRLATYQLIWGRTAQHHVVSESVEATRLLRKSRLSGLVNGVLRGLLREERPLASAPEAVQLAHPEWLLAMLKKDHPQHWQRIVAANNQQGPMCLRVDLARNTRQQLLQQLLAAGLSARAGQLAASSIYLQSATDVQTLPGFDQGLLSVQDEAAQLAGELLPAVPGGRVLDACAAPGGKSLHLLESGWEQLVAVDVAADRCMRIEENLARCGREAVVLAAHAGNPQDWWDQQPFAGILLDAPCSATGVIRRHPDIKQQRRASDITALATHQQHLLQALWPLLAPGGHLLYATCSVLRAENDAVIAAFLEQHQDAAAEPLILDGALGLQHGIQLLPDESAQDGFYYARLRKASPDYPG